MVLTTYSPARPFIEPLREADCFQAVNFTPLAAINKWLLSLSRIALTKFSTTEK
jgi:hypothetical protein